MTPNVVVTREQLCDNIGLGAFSDGWVARLGDQVPVQQVAPVEHVRIDGRRAHLRIVSWSAAGLEITQMVGLVVDGTDAYAVVGTASTYAFPSLADALRAAICGLRFTSTAVADPDAD